MGRNRYSFRLPKLPCGEHWRRLVAHERDTCELCALFGYLLIFPFHLWGMASLIGIGAIAVTMIGRPDDTITTSITTAVVMVVAAIGPHDAWRQPILRLVDTAVGVAVGVATAWTSEPRIARRATL